MAEEKKFLDAKGLRYFWEMCRLQNNEDFQTNLEIFEAMAQVLATKMQSPDGKGGVSEYFTAEEKEKLAKIKTIEEDGSIITTDSNNKAVSIATEEYVNTAINNIPVANAGTLGLVKTSEEVTAKSDGTLGLGQAILNSLAKADTAVQSIQGNDGIAVKQDNDTLFVGLDKTITFIIDCN